MASSRTPREVFLALVHGICAGRVDEVVDLYAEATTISHPFDPLKGEGLTSRAELARHFSRRPAVKTLAAKPIDIRIHETADPEVIVAEFAYAITHLETGASASYPCIFVMRVKDGRIVESRDYIDHLGSAEARGSLPALLKEIATRRGATQNGA